jgi:cytochrome c oxidase subunit II
LQSALDAYGREAEAVATLTWALTIGGAAIFVLVMILVALAVWRRPQWLRRRSTIIAGGVVFPIVTLSVLLVFGLVLERRIDTIGEDERLVVEVTAEQFWWRVDYLGDGLARTASANEIRIPVGAAVELRLFTRDVIHSFWVPSLAGKLDMIPGRENRMAIEATRAGVFRGQCAEYCGAQHAKMAFYVVAMPDTAFRRWLTNESGPAREPDGNALRQGRSLFLDNGCGVCHTVRGTSARGIVGPDLTHFGSRQSVAAGIYPQNLGTIAGWIASAQHLKPGSRMPSYRRFSGEELLALANYLESLQ